MLVAAWQVVSTLAPTEFEPLWAIAGELTIEPARFQTRDATDDISVLGAEPRSGVRDGVPNGSPSLATTGTYAQHNRAR